MRWRDRIILLVCIFLAAGLLIAAGSQLDRINRQRQDMKLIIDKPENLPPSLIFATVATGTFRGLFVDFLWIRADRLKEQGQFFDAKQLAELITVLQPRFATVWQFQAWNMAYNISVAVPETQPEQRWRWVQNGYELLRDQAIDKYKLNDIGLYHELARIFQHKIGGISDEAHKYYKLQLASQMSPLLASVDVQLNDQDNKYFDLLVKAPSSWRDALKDPNIVTLVNALKSADGKFLEESDFVGNYLSLRQNSARYNEDAGKVIDKYRGTDTLKKFDIFAKAYQLRNVWKLDPVLMRKVNQLYGPVDMSKVRVFVNRDPNSVRQDPNSHLPLNWRHADSHAIYWAEKGLEIASSRDRLSDSSRQAAGETGSAAAAAAEKRDYSADETNTDRIVVHSLQNLFRMGTLIILPVEKKTLSNDPAKGPQTVSVPEVFLRPDLRFFTPYNDTILRIIKKYDNSKNEGASQTLRDGHRNMMKNAVLLFYQSGHREQAQEIYDTMKKLYPMPEFNVPLKEYARSRLLDELQSIGIQDATEQITAILKQGYYYYSIRDDDAAAGSEKDAKDIYDYYQLQNEGNRTSLPSFDKMKTASMQDFRDDQQFPEYVRKDLFLNRLYIDNPEAYKWLMEQDKKKAEKTE